MADRKKRTIILSLKARLMISYGFMALFLVVSMLMISGYMLEHHFQAYVRQKQEQINQNLVAVVMDEFQNTGMPNAAFLSRLGDDALESGIMLMVNDSDGRQLYCAGCGRSGSCDNMLGMMLNTMRQRYPKWEGEYTEKVYPLEKDGQTYGSMTLGYFGPFYFNEDDMRFINLLNRISIASSVLFLSLAFVMGAFLAKRIVTPIKHVIDHTKAIQDNQYQKRIDYTTNTTEIDQLISSVNALATTLEMQQALKKRMAGDYAHEFRTPLAALQSNLEGMIDGIFDITPERLEGCRAEVLRLGRMTAQIDRLVELENNNLILNKEIFDLGELVNQCAMAFERELHDHDITLTLNAPGCEINADKDQISQVIINLLSNAVKYTGRGGQIHVALKSIRNSVSLTVSDTGVGIGPRDLPHIFEHLYRADISRSRGTGGSGIGLSVVKAIVNAHHGTIEVKSEAGRGSEFIMILKNCRVTN